MKKFLLPLFVLWVSMGFSQANEATPETQPYYYSNIVRLKIGNQHGTGFLIKKNLLVTNYHVVKEVIEAKRAGKEPENKIICTDAMALEMVDDDIRFNFEAKVFPEYIENDSIYLYSKQSDVIILDISHFKDSSRSFTLSEEPHLQFGQEVFSIGFLMTDQRASISQGVVGFMNIKYILPPEKNISNLWNVENYQTDIRTTHGGSGSPVIVKGENGKSDKVVGIMSSIMSANNRLVELLREHYLKKLDSVDLNIALKDFDSEEMKLFEKYLIYDTMYNDIGTISTFVSARHIEELLQKLDLGDR